jgi:small basic protein
MFSVAGGCFIGIVWLVLYGISEPSLSSQYLFLPVFAAIAGLFGSLVLTSSLLV